MSWEVKKKCTYFYTNHERYTFNMNLAVEIFEKISLEVFIEI